MKRRSRVVVVSAGMLSLGASVGACLPAPATEQARATSDLWTVFVVAASGVAILVWGLITVAIIRYRRRPVAHGAMPPPAQIHDAPRLEIAWTVGPIILVLVLFWMTLGALGQIEASQPGRVTVAVDAFRWQWRFDYQGTDVSVTGTGATPAEMVVPVGEPVHIVLTSEDVAHSFYVPAFLFKRDAIPGHPTEFDLTIDQPGGYSGQCAEFCGVFHDRMLLIVRAVTRPEYDAWLASKAGEADATSGATEVPAP
jgi:cytochrome c oxidase subunit II